jgi:Domain of unknown function (DUF4288)
MTKGKDVAPHGWYLASYLLRFVELADKDNDDPEKRFITWENTILLKANDLDEARAKAVKFARDETKPYKGGGKGIDVQWIFEGVTDVLPIYDELADGAEIMWVKHAPRKLRNIRKCVRREFLTR